MQLINKVTQNKLRGGFYTPEPIANFMLKWAFKGNKEMDVLEPSCGDGVFLKALKKERYQFKSFTAIEFEAKEAEKAKRINLKNTDIIVSDFHKYCIKSKIKFDLIIGNPPYIRYQYFDRRQQEFASKIFHRANLKYTKLTNAWVSFVVGSSLMLKEKGKIAFVLPAEILQVTYAKSLRIFLAHYYNNINIVSFRKLVFPNIQQEVVILLCEKNDSGNHLIEHIELDDTEELKTLDISKLKRPKKQLDFESNKWTFYFLAQDEIDFLEKLQKDERLLKLGVYAKVEVGITTGSNPFFTAPLSTVEKYNLQEYAKPLVGRSVQVPSVVFTKKDWVKNKKNGARTHLLTFRKRKVLEKNLKVIDYIGNGEKDKIHEGYKCRIREEWQIVPSLRISEALFIRRNNIYPKLIINEANAYTTDTMHRVTVNTGYDLKTLTASYYNSISLAFSEICGRSYGGGVLELMPNEVEEILLPYDVRNKNLLPVIDDKIRNKEDISEILKVTNKTILKDNLGFTTTQIDMANRIWEKLLNRRLNRGKRSSTNNKPCPN